MSSSSQHRCIRLIAKSTLLLCATAVTPICAQTASSGNDAKTEAAAEPQFTFHVSTRVVPLDVTVLDEHGKPVLGLKPTDFNIFEDGKQQSVRSFEEHKPAADMSSEAPRKVPKLPSNVFTNYTPAPTGQPLTVLLLDMLNTPLRDQSYVQTQLLKFLNGLKPGERVAIFGLNEKLLMLQGFTSDPKTLRDVLKRKGGVHVASIAEEASSDASNEAGQYGNSVDSTDVASNLQSFEQAVDGIHERLRLTYTLDALNQLGHTLSGIPGRKNVIWFSASFPSGVHIDAAGVASNSNLPDIAVRTREVTNALLASECAIYPVDAKGLFAPPMYSSNVSRGDKGAGLAQNVSANFQRTASSASSMKEIAADTGGQAFYNTNDLTDATRSAIDSGAYYYSIAYSPTNASEDGSYRAIKITVGNKNYQLAYRRGYYGDQASEKRAVDPAITSQEATIARAALQHGSPEPTDILFKTRILKGVKNVATVAAENEAEANEKGPWNEYVVDISADIRRIKALQSSKGLIQLNLETDAIVYGADGKMINAYTKRVEDNLSADGYRKTLASGLQLRLVISMPANKASWLRIALRDLASNRIGAIEVSSARMNSEAIPVPTTSSKK